MGVFVYKGCSYPSFNGDDKNSSFTLTKWWETGNCHFIFLSVHQKLVCTSKAECSSKSSVLFLYNYLFNILVKYDCKVYCRNVKGRDSHIQFLFTMMRQRKLKEGSNGFSLIRTQGIKCSQNHILRPLCCVHFSVKYFSLFYYSVLVFSMTFWDISQLWV